MTDLNNILNSPSVGNTILMVSAKDLKDFTDAIVAQTRRLVEEQHQPRFFTVKDMMKRFDVSQSTVYNWVKSGRIKSYKMGEGKQAHVYFDQAEVAQAVKDGYVGKYIHK